jgi:hypothetical protein
MGLKKTLDASGDLRDINILPSWPESVCMAGFSAVITTSERGHRAGGTDVVHQVPATLVKKAMGHLLQIPPSKHPSATAMRLELPCNTAGVEDCKMVLQIWA